MVIAKLIGGLGNQLFQYATARRLASVRGGPLKLDISGFEECPLRKYGLHHFNIAADIASPDDIAQVRKTGPIGLALRLSDMVRPYHRRHSVSERTLNFDPAVLRLSGDVYLEGYWASEKYFKDVEPLLRRELVVKTPPSEANIALAERIGQVTAVSVHVRRGDKISDPRFRRHFPALPLEYYIAAMDKVAGLTHKPHFFIFSDNAQWVRENVRSGHDITLVAHNGPDQDYEDLRLMSLCRHHVIANSTFSWWGAWLGRNADQVVVGPKRWMNFATFDPLSVLRMLITPRRWLDRATYDGRDLFPGGWIRM